MLKKLTTLVFSVLLAIPLALIPVPASAATSISITSPSNGSTATGSSFTATGTATANRTITVKVNGSTVGTTTSDGSGNWSLSVTGQTAGAKTVEATASGQDVYTNVTENSTSGHIAKINTLTNTQTGSFTTANGEFPFLVWGPNNTFTKAFGTNPFLNSPKVWTIDIANETVSNFTMTGTSPRAAGIAYNADGSKVYIADNENAVEHVYNTTTNAEIGSGITIGTVGVSHPHGNIHRPGTNEMWVANSGDNTFKVIDTTTDTITDTYSVLGSPVNTAFSPDGNILYTSTTGEITVVDANTGTTIGSMSQSVGAMSTGSLVLNNDGSKLYVSYPESNKVDVFNTNSRTLITTITVGTGPWGMTLNANESRLYVANPNLLGGLNGTTVSVINTLDNTVINNITTAGAPFLIYAGPVESSSASVSLNLNSADGLADTGDSTMRSLYLAFALITSGIACIYLLKTRFSN